MAVMELIAVAAGLGIYGMGAWRATAPTPVAPAQSGAPPASTAAALADLAAGTYDGEVTADSRGSSRSDITLTVTKVDKHAVRVTSDNRKMGTVDVTLTRADNKILSADGDSPFMLDLGQNPPVLEFAPHNELAYRGRKRQ